MAEIFESLMVIAFGISWPVSIYKSYKSRTARGKSAVFLCFILAGYICGIISKLSADNLSYVFVFYVINSVMVSADLLLFLRNTYIDHNHK